MDLLKHLVSSSEFMPHGYCYMWNQALLWLHLVSDALTNEGRCWLPLQQ
jgi:hypothetical protein